MTFVDYRAGAACSAYPTFVGGLGVTERTSVGLDVHARSVVAAAIDGVTGELIQTRLTPSREHIRSWLDDLTSGGGLRGRTQRVRAGAALDRGGDPVRGRGPIEAPASQR
jgi:hypothetical protein